jgi:hypothetical protein
VKLWEEGSACGAAERILAVIEGLPEDFEAVVVSEEAALVRR